jgi:hypothetical protein
MLAANRFGPLAVLATVAGALAGCAYQAIVLRDVHMKGDAWSMAVDVVRDGPDGFTTGGFGATYYTPKDGERFFWVRVTLRNDAATPRPFNFDRCDLDLADQGIVPAIVATAPMVFKADQVETLRAGDSIDRWLIFAYPRNASPTRLACAPMVVRLPPIPPR